MGCKMTMLYYVKTFRGSANALCDIVDLKKNALCDIVDLKKTYF